MKGTVVRTRTTLECAAENCDATEYVIDRVDSVLAFLDHRYGIPRYGLPDGWQEVGGRTYCPKHDIEIKAIVRTPNVTRSGRGFVAGYDEEPIQMQRSHINEAMDELHRRTKAAAEGDAATLGNQLRDTFGCDCDSSPCNKKRAA